MGKGQALEAEVMGESKLERVPGVRLKFRTFHFEEEPSMLWASATLWVDDEERIEVARVCLVSDRLYSDWAEVQRQGGVRQSRYTRCGKFRFPQEMTLGRCRGKVYCRSRTAVGRTAMLPTVISRAEFRRRRASRSESR
jgi:hypothetical protein